MQQNTEKYFPFLKIAFPKNIYFPENILHEPNTAVVSSEWKMGPYHVWIQTRTFSYRVKKKKKKLKQWLLCSMVETTRSSLTWPFQSKVSSHFSDIYSMLMHGFCFIKIHKSGLPTFKTLQGLWGCCGTHLQERATHRVWLMGVPHHETCLDHETVDGLERRA